jgi:hypothetical protein
VLAFSVAGSCGAQSKFSFASAIHWSSKYFIPAYIIPFIISR